MLDERAYVVSITGNNAIVIGSKYLTPLEVILRKGSEETNIVELLYIGKEKREKVYSIRKKSSADELVKVDETDFIGVLETIIRQNAEFSVNFLNNSKAASLKRHQLQLIHNVGEKIFQRLIEEREKEPFNSLEDAEERAESEIVKLLAKRIHLELTAPDKYYLFVKNPKQK